MPNRRSVVLGIAAMPIVLNAGRAFAQSGLTGDTVATAEGDVIIHPVGHASLAIGFGAHVIYVDPAKADFSGLPAPTAILVTHAHGDHFDGPSLEAMAGSAPILTTEEVAGKMPEALKAQTTVLKNGESGTIDGLAVDAIAAYNTTEDRKQYHPQGRDNGYVLSVDGRRVYIAGDTEDIPEMRALKDIDIAFVPMNLPFTMDVDQASSAVAEFAPGHVYPYHYKGSDPLAFATRVEAAGKEITVVQGAWYA